MIRKTIRKARLGRWAGTLAVLAASALLAAATGPSGAQTLSAAGSARVLSAESYGAWAAQLLAAPPAGLGFLVAAEDELLARANRARAEAGLGSLQGSAELRSIARVHAADMIQRGFFDHINPDGRGPGDRVAILSRTFIGTSGENIAQRSGTIDANAISLARHFHGNWMTSSGHRRNILGGDWTSLGIGVAIAGHPTGRIAVAVQVFANERGRLDRPAPLRVPRGARLDLVARGVGGPARLFDLWDPRREIAVAGPNELAGGTVEVPPGTYALRFYFGQDNFFQIFSGPQISVE